MHQQTIVVALVGVALVSIALLLPRTSTIMTPAQPTMVQPSASRENPNGGSDPSTQSFEDLKDVSQRFADELGRLKDENRTVSPATLAQQANNEPAYPMSATAASNETFDAETIYARAKPGVVVVGGVYKCNKCNHWHVR